MKDRILVILPTKERPALFELWAQSWLETTEGLSDVIVIVDANDESYTTIKDSYPQFIWKTVTPLSPITILNYFAFEYSNEYRWISFMEDDCQYKSPKWESAFIDKLRKLGKNGIVFPYDGLNGSPSNTLSGPLHTVSLPIIDRRIIKRLGFMAPPEIKCHYADNFWTKLALDLDKYHYFNDIYIQHNHYSATGGKMDKTAESVNARGGPDAGHYNIYMSENYPKDILKLQKKVLVLGGGGFIAGALAAKLKEQGEYVRVVDLVRNEFREDLTLADVDEFHTGDLRDLAVVSKFLTPDIDIVYQLAANMGGAGYVFVRNNDADILHDNALINLNVLKIASQVKPKQMFFSSSACTYPQHMQTDPNNATLPEHSTYPADPDSEYGWEKLFAERLYFTFRRIYGIDIRIARFHNIYGPYGTFTGGKEKVVAAMLRKVINAAPNAEIELWGDGQQTRTFLYIDDCIDAIQRLMAHPTFYGPVNMGTEELITIDNVAKMAMEIAGRSDLKIKHIDGPLGVRGRCSDNTLIKKELEWEPSTPLRTGMTLTYNWLKELL